MKVEPYKNDEERCVYTMWRYAILIPLLILSPLRVAAAQPSKPNVLVILADDMGFSDLGCYGSEIQTPNLDALAQNGLRLTQFYNTSRCCPTRASLLTGLYSHRAGMGHMVDDRGTPAYRGRLNEQCATVAELLGPAGYRTYMVGKWHVGSKQPHWPLDRGFHRFYGQPVGGGSYFTRKTDRQFVLDDKPYDVPDEPGYYKTDDYTHFALKFLDEHAALNQPFYLHLCYTAPHWPIQAPEKDIEKYRETYTSGWDSIRARRFAKQAELGLFDKSAQLSPRAENMDAWESLSAEKRADWARRMAVHAAMVEIMDRNIGRVVEKLKAMGQFENTLILFLSDNGASAEQMDRGPKSAVPGTPESNTAFFLPGANTANTPFRFHKSIVHEGGICTPLIAHAPNWIAKGRISAQPAHVIDVVPTVLDLAGVPYPNAIQGRSLAPLDGLSLVPLLKADAPAPDRRLFWEHEGNRAIRHGDWKLVARKNQPWELYNLTADRTELKDRAAEEPARVKELAAHWEAWAKDVGVQNASPGKGKAKEKGAKSKEAAK